MKIALLIIGTLCILRTTTAFSMKQPSMDLNDVYLKGKYRALRNLQDIEEEEDETKTEENIPEEEDEQVFDPILIEEGDSTFENGVDTRPEEEQLADLPENTEIIEEIEHVIQEETQNRQPSEEISEQQNQDPNTPDDFDLNGDQNV